jgi:hypothetical protein
MVKITSSIEMKKYPALALASILLSGCVYEAPPPPVAAGPPGYYAQPCCYSYYQYPPYYYGPSVALDFEFGGYGGRGWHNHHGRWR